MNTIVIRPKTGSGWYAIYQLLSRSFSRRLYMNEILIPTNVYKQNTNECNNFDSKIRSG